MRNYECLLEKFNKELYDIFIYADEFQQKVYESMKYSLSSGGKRVRPLLCMLTFLEFEEEDRLQKIMPFAIAIELIHTYSLIHDDLPAMDNDNMRRGKPTNHKVFTEGIAILAGDALLNMAAELLSKHIETIEDIEELRKAVKAMRYLFNATGVQGMIGGQVIDIDFPVEKYTREICENMYRLKTAALIKAAVVTGALIAGVDDETVTKLSRFATCIGLAYQFEDDILDGKGDREKDEINMLNFINEEDLKKEIINITQKGYQAIEDLSLKRNDLPAFTDQLINRRY